MTIYCFDIDGTICTNTDGDYKKAEPYMEAINKVNRLYQEGNTIVFYTARGSTTGIDWSKFTRQQLDEWNVRYHTLYLSKPHADHYVDDKGISTSDWLDKYQDGSI